MGVLVFGGIGALLVICIRVLFGSPYATLHLLSREGVMPPPFVMSIIWICMYFLLGVQFGLVYCRQWGNCSEVFGALVPFTAAVFFGPAFYPLYFTLCRFFAAICVELAVIFLMLVSLIGWKSVSAKLCVIPAIYLVWSVYALFLAIVLSVSV